VASNYVNEKVIIITGAASGFGRIVAEKTSALGARVVLADVNESELEKTEASISATGGQVASIVADVTDREQMARLATEAIDRFGTIDVMINNAGVMPLAFFADHVEAAEAWDRCIDINFKGVLHGMSAVHDQMISQGRGHIVNISSIYGNYPVTGAAVYGATKAAVRFLTEAFRQESQGRIKVTTIRPTGVPTTGLGAGVINMEAIGGVIGLPIDEYLQKMGILLGDNPPEKMTSPDSMEYFALSADLLADQIVFAINQPWGVSISDITIRASGDPFMI